MEISCDFNNLSEKEITLKALIEKYVLNPEKYNELENIKYSTIRTELNKTDSIEIQGLEHLADDLCVGLLIDAVAITNSKLKDVKYFVEIKEEFYSKDDELISKWTSMKEFDLNKFRFLINDYISKWKLSSGIKYCIQYQSSRTANVSSFHDFLVMFSIPTNACPNPQVVAYVYFTVESSHCLPDTEPIFVTYKFEQYFKTYVANNDFDFQDMFIKLILISKSRMYEAQNY